LTPDWRARAAGLTRRFDLRLALLLVAALAAGLGAIAVAAVPLAERLLLPEIAARAEVVAGSLSRQIGRALDLGIPAQGLVGVEAVFAELLAANPEFAAIRLSGPDGAILAQAGAATPGEDAARAPVVLDGHFAAEVAVALDPGHVRRLIAGLWVNLGIVTVVTVLLAIELLPVILGAAQAREARALEERRGALAAGDLRLPPAGAQTEPALERLHARHAALIAAAGDRRDLAARLAALARDHGLGERAPPPPETARALRLPLFLFMLGHEMTRPFVPGVVIERARGLGWITPELAVGVAISLLMAVVAGMLLPVAVWSARYGRGRAFRLGAGVAAAGYAGAALAPGYLAFLTGWALVGAGYAMVFAAAQGFVIDTERGAARTRGLTVLVGAIMVAALCGPPVGGLLADRFGAGPAFAVVVLLTLAGLRLAVAALPPGADAARRPRGRWRDLLRAPSLAALMFGVALPAKLMLSGLCFFLLPVELLAQGASDAEIGRLQMVYPLATVFMVPLVSLLATELDLRLPFVLAGQLLSAGAACLVLLGTAEWALAALLLAFGAAQSLLITPQAGLVGELAARRGMGEDAAYGLFRLVERSGSALGPVLAGIVMSRFGFPVSILTLGAIVLAGTVIFLAARYVEGLRHARAHGI
jgi:predicted MFS family arabinose efflux permease